MNKIIIKKGRNLSYDFIKQWNKIMLKTFSEKESMNLKKKREFINDIFFIFNDEKGKLLFLGRLRPVKLKFLKKSYNILGVADIVSITKRKGYGKILMKEMLKYIKSKDKTAIGFCESKNSPFYEKSGFKIEKNLVKKFIYKNPQGKIMKDEGDEDVLYFQRKDNFMKKILLNPKEKVLIPIPHW